MWILGDISQLAITAASFIQEKTQGAELGFLLVFSCLASQRHVGKAMWEVRIFPKSDHFVNMNILDKYEQKDPHPSPPPQVTMYNIDPFLICQILLVESRLAGLLKVNTHLINFRRFFL